MIDKDNIKTYLANIKIDDEKAEKLADTISRYAETYNLKNDQIEGLFKKFNATSTEGLDALRGKRDAIKEMLLKRIVK